MTKPSTPAALFTVTLLAAVCAAGVVNAQAATPSDMLRTAAPALPQQQIDQRQDSQAQRIEQGVASGALTGRETRRLGREQASITRTEARAQADGKLTRREARHIQHRQDLAGRDIYRQKHDAQLRPQ